MIPHKLFDRLFGKRDEGWVARKQSVLDAVQDDAKALAIRARQAGPDARSTSI